MSGYATDSTMDDRRTAHDLARRLARVERRRRTAAWLPLGPAFVFLLVAFVIPILLVLARSVAGSGIDARLPLTASAIAAWSGERLPGDGVYTAFAADLKRLGNAPDLYRVARELNYRQPGLRSALVEAGRAARTWNGNAGRDDLVRVNPVWGDLRTWRALKATMGSITSYRLLAALDLRESWDGGIEWAPADQRIYLDILARTFWISGIVTLACLLIGYPLAYVTANGSGAMAKILMVLLLIPCWTSILVRTAAWLIILQNNGVVNGGLEALGIVREPIALIYNRLGLCIVMVSVQMPFMVLPLHSVMKGIPRNLVLAASSLGARPASQFLRVYLPLSVPGIAAGTLLTFILSLGFYITPALVGGPTDQMENSIMARFALGDGNWGMAAAMAVILVACIVVVYAVYSRFVRVDGIKTV